VSFQYKFLVLKMQTLLFTKYMWKTITFHCLPSSRCSKTSPKSSPCFLAWTLGTQVEGGISWVGHPYDKVVVHFFTLHPNLFPIYALHIFILFDPMYIIYNHLNNVECRCLQGDAIGNHWNSTMWYQDLHVHV
jgi:hypothetical protein